ncbi:MAG: hypothetical protein Q4C91_06060 [Eubacteriales bacterium]|nr:hypothetical protein [Eubacteriales bacterium]
MEREAKRIDVKRLIGVSVKDLIEEFIEKMRKQEKERVEEEERKEKALYAAPLPDGVIIPSANAGARECDIPTEGETYRSKNMLLRSLYRCYEPDVTDHNCHLYGSVYNIKVYITVEGTKLRKLFTGAMKILLERGTHSFAGKVSKKKRLEHMCFWVGRDDFFLLEEYFSEYADRLITPIPFVAYRGKLGISREFRDWPSHNGKQAQMISDYFSTIRDEDEISVAEMYSMFVRAWNGDLPQDHPMIRDFKDATAQTLLVLLDSIDVIFGKKAIDDDHLLLSEDEQLWEALSRWRCWKEVGDIMSGGDTKAE